MERAQISESASGSGTMSTDPPTHSHTATKKQDDCGEKFPIVWKEREILQRKKKRGGSDAVAADSESEATAAHSIQA